MSSHYPFSARQEREILDLLEKEGPKLHNDIIKALKKRSKGFSESRLNDYLNGMVAKDRIFRIEKDGKIWYRINNFPPNIKGIIAILRTLEQHDPTTKSFTHKYIENLCLFHGKLPDENILKLTILELAVEIQTVSEAMNPNLTPLLTQTPTQAQVLRVFREAQTLAKSQRPKLS
jgi:hypothetical protein